MGGWETYRLVADVLRAAAAGERVQLRRGPAEWTDAVSAASHHLVSPAFALALAGETEPADVGEYFEGVLELNRLRNAEMLECLGETVAALNRIGIEPVLLKGAAFLVDGSYGDLGGRMMGDLDLLVPDERGEQAVKALIEAGYGPPRREAGTPVGHHHLPPQRHSASGVTTELHVRPVERRLARLLDGEAMKAASLRVRVGAGWAATPNPTDRLVHCIAHGQISDRHHRRGFPRLRTMMDLAVLSRRYADEIDWEDIEARFQRTGFGPVMRDTLSQAALLCGADIPAHVRWRDDGDVAARMRRAMERGSAERRGLALLWTIQDGAMALGTDWPRLGAAIRKRRWRARSRESARSG